MYAIGILVACFFTLWALETRYPNFKLPPKKGWYFRAFSFNLLQMAIGIVGYYTWESSIANGYSLFKLRDRITPFWGGLYSYFIVTWIFYWWHRIRHESRFLWLTVHQFHHSPERIEVATSFYKHPFEIMANSFIIAILVYPIMGLTVESNTWLTLFAGLGEFFYHMNLKTPHWIGYFIQRPESHCLHHIQDKRYCKNYADLPLWDILGGTFENPTEQYFKIGFSNNKEENIKEMMLCKDVVKGRPITFMETARAFVITSIVLLGALSSIGFAFSAKDVQGIGFVTTASPLPFVFSSYNGVETFSTTYDFDIQLKNGTVIHDQMDHIKYQGLEGPYNRRNVYGAVFSHGPFFNKENLIEIRDQILDWGICYPGTLAGELGIHDPIDRMIVSVRSKTKGNEDKVWAMEVQC